MPSRRYTIVVADRATGVVRRFTLGLRPALITLSVVASMPVLIGMGAAWKAKADVADLYAQQATLASLAPRLRQVSAAGAAPLSQLAVRTDGGWPALLAGFLRTRKRRLAAGARR